MCARALGREDGGVRGKRREVNGENVILGQIFFVFFLLNPTARNIEDERVKSVCSNTVWRGVEEAEVGCRM